MSAEETIPQMRDRIDAQNKQLAGLRKQNQELRTAAAEAVFEQQGYNPRHAELFVNQTAEQGTVPTPETVAAFAGEWDLAKPQLESEQSSAPAETEEAEEQPVDQQTPGSALAPMSRSGSSEGAGAGGAGTEKMTRQEWIQLSKTDKGAADTALRQGKVQLSGDAPPVVGNPYDQ